MRTSLCLAILIFLSLHSTGETITATVTLNLDQEERKPTGGALNSGTQSVNRYHSDLRGVGEATLVLDKSTDRLRLRMGSEADAGVALEGLNIRQLVPLLPYEHAPAPDAFDAANLMLAEYARNGVSLSHQKENLSVAHFYTQGGFLGSRQEYLFADGAIAPNPALAPNRMGLTNNCLFPGLWELNASDSAGEMYHAWFTLPDSFYLAMVRAANELNCDDETLADALAYTKHFDKVAFDADRLRKLHEELGAFPAALAADKQIGGYSSQDSRRKVQRGFYKIVRDGKPANVETFGELRAGDLFSLHAFIPPGVYTTENPQQIPFDPTWDIVAYRFVDPKTRYEGNAGTHGELGHVEIEIRSTTTGRAVIAGNVPVALLVFQEDYAIPAFGAGVLPASELIERRHFRLTEGPHPHYAYLVEQSDSGYEVLNNHEEGLEQIFLRPIEKEGKIHLRITMVSYERIVDLMEVTAPVPKVLADRIRKASEGYKPPLFRTYSDANLL